MKIKSLELYLGYTCNYKCIFCFENDVYKYSFISKDEILKKINYGIINGYNHIVFSGGEPTLDINLLEYIFYAKKIGYNFILIHTNGFKTSDNDFLLGLYKSGLTGIILSIHGIKKISDIITQRDDSFTHIIDTLKNVYNIKKIYDPSFVLDTNTVICKYNYKYLINIVNILRKFDVGRIAITYPNTDNYISNLNYLIDYKFLRKIISDLLIYIDTIGNQDFILQGFPFCEIDNKYWKYITFENINKEKNNIETGLIEKDDYNDGYVKIDLCIGCKESYKCNGFSKMYVRKFI